MPSMDDTKSEKGRWRLDNLLVRPFEINAERELYAMRNPYEKHLARNGMILMGLSLVAILFTIWYEHWLEGRFGTGLVVLSLVAYTFVGWNLGRGSMSMLMRSLAYRQGYDEGYRDIDSVTLAAIMMTLGTKEAHVPRENLVKVSGKLHRRDDGDYVVYKIVEDQ